jgi:hypothetical protein
MKTREQFIHGVTSVASKVRGFTTHAVSHLQAANRQSEKSWKNTFLSADQITNIMMSSIEDDALLLLDLPQKEEADKELLSAAQVLAQRKTVEPERKRLRQEEKKIRTCNYCQATETPMWRHGPEGYRDLCNKVAGIDIVWC